MGGVGFWALGYEGTTNEIWKAVDEELGEQYPLVI